MAINVNKSPVQKEKKKKKKNGKSFWGGVKRVPVGWLKG